MDEVLRIGNRDYAGRIRVIQADESPIAWRSGIWMHHHRFKLDGEQVRFHCENDRRVNTKTPEWQWCHSNIKISRSNGAQCIIVQRRTSPPCNRVNQEQSDKRVRSWPGRGPQGTNRQYHSHARGRAIPIEDSTYCARSNRQYSKQ